MTYDDIAELFLTERDPQGYAEFQSKAAKACREYLEKSGLGYIFSTPFEDLVADRNARMLAYWTERLGNEEHAKNFLSGYRSKLSRAKGGKTIPEHLEEQVKAAVTAFVEVDRVKGSSAEAVNAAKNAIDNNANFNHAVDIRTIRTWLDEIIPFSEIEKSRRGRPPKKGKS